MKCFQKMLAFSALNFFLFSFSACVPNSDFSSDKDSEPLEEVQDGASDTEDSSIGDLPGDEKDSTHGDEDSLAAPPDIPKISASSPESPSKEREIRLMGTTSPKSRVLLYEEIDCEGSAIGEGEADEDGAFEIEVKLEKDKTYAFFGKALSEDGLFSPCSLVPFVFVQDSTPTQRPVLKGTTPASPNNLSSRPELKGYIPELDEGDVKIQVFFTEDCEGDIQATASVDPRDADGNGKFRVKVDVPNGEEVTLAVRSLDAAGNASSCSDVLNYYYFEAVLSDPLLSTEPESPSFESEPKLLAYAPDAVKVAFFTDPYCEDELETVETDRDDFAIYSFEPNDNDLLTLYARSEDALGNQSACLSIDYLHDDEPPSQPTITSTAPESPSNQNTFNLYGMAEADANIRLYRGQDCENSNGSGTTTVYRSVDASSEGAFTIEGVVASVAVPDQKTTSYFTMTARDKAGNVSECSDVIKYVHDLKRPKRPVYEGTVPSNPNCQSEASLKFSNIDGKGVFYLYEGKSCEGEGDSSPTRVAIEDTEEGDEELEVTIWLNAESSYYVARFQSEAGNLSNCTEKFQVECSEE